ncbi:TPA: SIR2 family protein [Burkholderia vietnamiensis]|uniref:SIR2 family NAD-dependent protein deacylase n=1 Tax=Burkholderia vietnamiensis TaxID=60552 RepID=UPI001B9B77F9|nr:SIR2 family protein [Burkholderia vietnamiensis]MBR7913078.1 SIR2 family protein [Burkholderia vietnamiensis]HDR9277527.1 SIR2 family protein [Burkholderia vietnamiensis]
MTSLNAAGQRPPSWKGFLEAGIARCAGSKAEMNKLLRNGDYLSCCQIIKYKLDHDWIPFLEQQFLNPQFLPNKLHEAVFSLDSSIVLTPNFGKIFDNYAAAQSHNLLKIKKYYDDDIPRVLRGGGHQRLILKIHGCIDTPDKLIFTREDYADIRNKNANFYKAIDALVLTHTFLFVGCGMNDPDLALILEQYARSFGAAPPQYVALSGKISSEYKRMLSKNYNLKVLEYSPAHDHKELLDSVLILVDLVEAERAKLAGSTLW